MGGAGDLAAGAAFAGTGAGLAAVGGAGDLAAGSAAWSFATVVGAAVSFADAL